MWGGGDFIVSVIAVTLFYLCVSKQLDEAVVVLGFDCGGGVGGEGDGCIPNEAKSQHAPQVRLR